MARRPYAFLNSVPAVLRPLLVLALPAWILHATFMRTEAPLPPLAPPTVEASQSEAKKFVAPRESHVQYLITHTDEFATPKKAVCPKSGWAREQSVVCSVLKQVGYIAPPPASATGSYRDLIFLTPEAYYALSGDLVEDRDNITVVVGRKVFISVSAITEPPQMLAPPLRHATRADFSWRWSSTNKVADYLEFIPATPRLTGVAYLQLDHNSVWHIAQIEFHDTSPDFETPSP